MNKECFEFLEKLLETPSPSGFEQAIQRVVKKRVSQFADEVTVDVHGNLIAAFNPEGKVRVMLAGHCDQIGMMVTHIDKQQPAARCSLRRDLRRRWPARRGRHSETRRRTRERGLRCGAWVEVSWPGDRHLSGQTVTAGRGRSLHALHDETPPD